ncbi:MAG: hypothetical protein HC810_08910 [Acaryochloridaceae cyanobacterium RL_2_7]|nr:hypothetical protein [Acaryochloridaceae cyanobacterium RL_2_7]
MKRLEKGGQGLPDIYVVPLALKYQYQGNVLAYIDNLLLKIEGRLKISAPKEMSRYQRLRAIAICIIERIESEYGVESVSKVGDLSESIESLKVQLLECCEAVVGQDPNPNFSFRERIYQVEAALVERPESLEGMTPEMLKRSISRLFNFAAISDGYVAENPTPERFLDVLVRFQREVFEIDRPQSEVMRWAYLQVGELFNLKDYWAEYKRDRHSTVERLIQKAQAEVQRKLDEFPQPPIDPSWGLGE